MKLFVVMVGGDMPNSNIELHDIRFVVGDKIEDCFDQLKAQWWGVPESLHLDCWGALEATSGYTISLRSTPSSRKEKLFFVHMGGYTPKSFTELHYNTFIVETSAEKALASVKLQDDLQMWELPHKDNQFEIDKMIDIQEQLKLSGLYIHLEQVEQHDPFAFKCDYVPFAKPGFTLKHLLD